MSYSHSKYRQREYRQRDRQYQYHNYQNRKSRHDRDRYYDNRYNRQKALRSRNSYNNQTHPQFHLQSAQYYPQSDTYSNHGQQAYDHRNNNGTYSNYSNDSYSSLQSQSSYRSSQCGDFYSESVDDWRYDEGEDEDEHDFIPPLSPLDLERKQYQLYIKKNSDLHHIYLYQSDAKNTGTKTSSLDIRAAEAKNVNNWNKYVEISNGIKQSYLNNNSNKISVLEIGCGSGNNLGIYKENKNSIARYVGIDSAYSCIERAIHKYHDTPFDVEFICRDIFAVSSAAEAASPAINNRFDLINIDLSSLHNAFKCKTSLLMFLRLISEWTHAKSLLMCSFVRDDIIVERFTALLQKNSILNLISAASHNDDNMLWQNRYQSISMKRKDFNVIRNLYNGSCKDEDGFVGSPYIYYQMHSVDNIKEYFICFDYLSKMLYNHCNMKLVYRHNASDIYSKYSNTFSEFNGKMVPHSDTWTQDERQVIDTYGYALFQRY